MVLQDIQQVLCRITQRLYKIYLPRDGRFFVGRWRPLGDFILSQCIVQGENDTNQHSEGTEEETEVNQTSRSSFRFLAVKMGALVIALDVVVKGFNLYFTAFFHRFVTFGISDVLGVFGYQTSKIHAVIENGASIIGSIAIVLTTLGHLSDLIFSDNVARQQSVLVDLDAYPTCGPKKCAEKARDLLRAFK